MRILFLTQGHPPYTWTGASTAIFHLARAVAAQGHEVHVLDCTHWYHPRNEHDGGVVVHRRRTLRVRGVRRLQRLLRRLRIGRPVGRRRSQIRAAGFMTQLNYALSYYREYRRLGIHFDVVVTGVDRPGLLFALLRLKPLLLRPATPELLMAHVGRKPLGTATFGPELVAARPEPLRVGWRTRIDIFLQGLVGRRGDALFGVSRPHVEMLEKVGWPIRSEGAFIVGQAIDPGLWASTPPAEGTGPLVLAPNRLSWEKAPEVLVGAAAYLKPFIEELEVVFAGHSVGELDGSPYRDSLIRLASELGAPCRFLDHLPYPEVMKLYESARVVVIPSRFELYSMAGLEALAAGRPVVCTTLCGLADVVATSGAGVVVPPNDPEALAEALRPYLESPQEAAKAGERARTFVKTRLAPERIARNFEIACDEAIRHWQERRGARSPARGR